MSARGKTGAVVEPGSEVRPQAGATSLDIVIRTHNLRKVFRSGWTEITPLAGLSFEVRRGELVAIVGPSGSGKSTLLHLLAALDTPTSGTIHCAGVSLNSLRGVGLAEFRNQKIGFVWQRHHLLPDFTAAENVAAPLRVRGVAEYAALKTAREWLGEVGLAERAQQPAGALSGGERQRVAIARALVNLPEVLLADEPTGDLDEVNATAIFQLVVRLHRSCGLTSVLATHNLSLAQRADRVLRLEHGRLELAGDSRAAQEAGAAWAGH